MEDNNNGLAPHDTNDDEIYEIAKMIVTFIDSHTTYTINKQIVLVDQSLGLDKNSYEFLSTKPN